MQKIELEVEILLTCLQQKNLVLTAELTCCRAGSNKRYLKATYFTTRAEWKTGGLLQGNDIVFFAEESKMVCGVGVEIFSNTHGVSGS